MFAICQSLKSGLSAWVSRSRVSSGDAELSIRLSLDAAERMRAGQQRYGNYSPSDPQTDFFEHGYQEILDLGNYNFMEQGVIDAKISDREKAAALIEELKTMQHQINGLGRWWMTLRTVYEAELSRQSGGGK